MEIPFLLKKYFFLQMAYELLSLLSKEKLYLINKWWFSLKKTWNLLEKSWYLIEKKN